MLIVNGIEFIESNYYIVKNGKTYKNVHAGLIETSIKVTRRVGDYKLIARHFDCALPYTNYYLIDSKNDKIYESKDHIYSCLKEIIKGLKEMLG